MYCIIQYWIIMYYIEHANFNCRIVCVSCYITVCSIILYQSNYSIAYYIILYGNNIIYTLKKLILTTYIYSYYIKWYIYNITTLYLLDYIVYIALYNIILSMILSTISYCKFYCTVLSIILQVSTYNVLSYCIIYN